MDCTSPNVALAAAIDGEVARVTTVGGGCTARELQPIVVRADAQLSNGLPVSSQVTIPVSADSQTDGWLAVARSPSALDGYRYLESF